MYYLITDAESLTDTSPIVGNIGCRNLLTIASGGSISTSFVPDSYNCDFYIGFGTDTDATQGCDNSIVVTGSGNNTSTDDTTGTGMNLCQALFVGNYGGGNSLTIRNGADVSCKGSGFFVGVSKVGHNSATVRGYGSTLKVSNSGSSQMFAVGLSAGDNTLSITSHGSVDTGTAGAYIGYAGAASGNAVTVDGLGSTWVVGGALTIGSSAESSGNFGNTLTILNGALVTCTSLTINTTTDASLPNCVRLNGGFLAVNGDLTGSLSGFAGKMQAYNTASSGYLTLTADNASTLFKATYCDSAADLQLALGNNYGTYLADYGSLLTTLSGGYTILTSMDAAVPEPSDYALFGSLLALGFAVRRRNQS